MVAATVKDSLDYRNFMLHDGLVVRRARPHHIRHVALHLRPTDSHEAAAMTGLSAADAVYESVRQSDHVWAVLRCKKRYAAGEAKGRMQADAGQYSGLRAHEAKHLSGRTSGASGQSASASRADTCKASTLLCCRPVALFGVGAVNLPVQNKNDYAGMVGIPWFVATPEVSTCSRHIMHAAEHWLDAFSRQYPLLVNAVHGSNHASQRWLRRFGFTLRPADGVGKLLDAEWYIFTRHKKGDICV